MGTVGTVCTILAISAPFALDAVIALVQFEAIKAFVASSSVVYIATIDAVNTSPNIPYNMQSRDSSQRQILNSSSCFRGHRGSTGYSRSASC